MVLKTRKPGQRAPDPSFEQLRRSTSSGRHPTFSASFGCRLDLPRLPRSPPRIEASSHSQPPDTFVSAMPPNGVSQLPVPASIPTLGSSVSALAHPEARRPRSCRPQPVRKLTRLFLVGLGLVLTTFYLSLGVPRIRLGPDSRQLRLGPPPFSTQPPRFIGSTSSSPLVPPPTPDLCPIPGPLWLLSAWQPSCEWPQLQALLPDPLLWIP